MTSHEPPSPPRATPLLSSWLVVLALSSLLIHLAGLDETFAYRRALVERGEVWRLFSGHLAHLGTAHLLENLGALLLVGWLVGEQYSARRWWLIAAACAFAISVALYLLNPAVEWYVGLSGVLHGLLVAGLWAQLRRRESVTTARLLLLCIAGKLLWEQWAGPLPGSERLAGGTVIVAAHLYGALAGLGAALIGLRWPAGRRR